MKALLRFMGIVGVLPAFVAGTGIAARLGWLAPMTWGVCAAMFFVLLAVCATDAPTYDDDYGR